MSVSGFDRMDSRGAGQHLRTGGQRLPPRWDTLDLDLDRETQYRPDEHDHAEDRGVGQRRGRRDGLDDVGRDEQFQTEKNCTAE